MNLKDQKKKYYVSVRKLISVWKAGGIKAAEELLYDPKSIIEKDSWVSKIKNLYEEKKIESLREEIKLISSMFKND